MSLQVDYSAEPRAPLSRERVLRAAIALADQGGIEVLSMRKLAQALTVEAMSLYHHVAKKEDLLKGIIDLVLSEIELPEGSGWKLAMRRTALSAHHALLRHPWACSLVTSATGESQARLRWMEAVLRCLREEGFTADLAHHAYHALDSHIVGFTLWQVSFGFDKQQLNDLAAIFLQRLPLDQYPYVAEHIGVHLHESEEQTGSEFEFGLDLILDGLERMRGVA
jgi:AcrR family transcriptional regulator